MNRKMFAAIITAAILMVSTVPAFATGWDDRDNDRDDRDFAGAVYTMTNAADNNEVVIFSRDEDGMLTRTGAISTGGAGSGGGLDPLASQGSIVLSKDGKWLLAVNAGSNDISVFRVMHKGLKLVDRTGSGGAFPVSLAVFHNLVYVLNAGSAPNITGFYLSHRGKLIPLDDSTRMLGSGAFSQVGFDPDGETLVVTDRGENEILVYSLGHKGLPAMSPVISPSNGLVPFGFIFDQRGHLLVVEAGSGAVSSYKILRDDALKVISPSVANGQIAACWIAGTERGDVFTANTGSGTISAYKLRTGNGMITLRDAVAGTAVSPIDMAITADGRFLYALDPGNGTVHMFRIKRDGTLIDLGEVAGGLSIFAQGVAAK